MILSKLIYFNSCDLYFCNSYPCLYALVGESDWLMHQLVSGIWDERNWPYQCGASQTCLQLDEQSNNFHPIAL